MFRLYLIVRNLLIGIIWLCLTEGFRTLSPSIKSNAATNRPKIINTPIKSDCMSSFRYMSVQEPEQINLFDQLLTEEYAPLLVIPPQNSSLVHINSIVGIDGERWRQAIKFIGILQRAFLEKDANLLINSLAPNCQWNSPLVADIQELKEELPKFMSFFGDPRLQVFNLTLTTDNQLEISYQLSMWWPMPWRPRIIIPGTAMIFFAADNTVTAVASTWQQSPFQIFTQQFPPRIWDLYSVFASPTPEYPPVQTLGAFQKVKFLKLPQTVTHRVTWTAPAKYRGPPITVIPDFALTGFVPNTPRGESPLNPLQATLPIDVQSSRFTYQNREFKMTSWRFHVPTALQSVLAEKIRNNWSQAAEGDTLLSLASDNDYENIKALPTDEVQQQEEREEETEAGSLSEDRVIVKGKDNLSLMQSVKNGAMRGILTPELRNSANNKNSLNFLTKDEMIDFEKNQHVYRSLQVESERIVAAVDIRGEIDANKINKALQMITQAVNTAPYNNRYRIKRPAVTLTNEIKSLLNNGAVEEDSISNVQSLFGLRLGATKMCFDHTGEPAMAVYELQYKWRLFTVTVELEEI